MSLPFEPRPGKSPSGYEVRNFPTKAASPGRYQNSFPTTSGQLPLNNQRTTPEEPKVARKPQREVPVGTTSALPSVKRKIINDPLF